ncbi:hypothetical protein RJ639_005901 [Escallonia herrerae]|uniref:Cytochrome P450 n=1 Tax=Escallonia herrerae TaxID=1293975 RepID=A0AA88VWR8_9ASTE|nr:hypothetical protein RJ639_005901 [Escallonia herrerae]
MGVGGLEKRLVALQVKRDAFVQGLVDERRGGSGGGDEAEGRNKTMIEVLLGLQAKEPYPEDDFVIWKNSLAAGTDTSAGTMEWTLSLLLNNPDHLKKAQAEIGNCIGQDCLVDESGIADLPYLRCIMNEALLMYPAGPLLVSHESSQECTVGSYRVPKGTMLLFESERFEGLEGSRDGFKFVPFGFGRRACPGESLAMRVVGLALGSLLQCFDWERVSKEMVDMTKGPGLTMPKAQPLVATCRPRPIMVHSLSQI